MIAEILSKLKGELQNAFINLDEWFAVNDSLLNYRPQNGGWSTTEILEHVSLTNHYLLILIRKGTEKALQKASKLNLASEVSNYEFNWNALQAIGEHGLFEWNRPEHMEPTKKVLKGQVKSRLNEQLNECLGYLQRMPNGEGALYKTTMSVNNLGKIDVYHYIYFLAQHIQRHIKQMEKILLEFKNTFA